MKKKIAIGIAVLLGCGLLYLIITFVVPIGLLLWDVNNAKVTVIEDTAHYNDCLGENSDETYGKDFNELFEVFPHVISNTADVKEFKYVYYNPWDPQYVSYITIQYNEDEYKAEIDRLNHIGVDNYEGIYSVTGAPKGYKLAALKSDDYSGFGYAIIPENGNNCITYVGIDFCNYFLDLDINEYVPGDYLLSGFDASMDNPYRNSKMNKSVSTKALIEDCGEFFSINGNPYVYCPDLENFTVTEKLIGKTDDGMKIYMIDEYPDYEYVVGYYDWAGEVYKRVSK